MRSRAPVCVDTSISLVAFRASLKRVSRHARASGSVGRSSLQVPLPASVLALLLLAFVIYVRRFLCPVTQSSLCPWYLSVVFFVFFCCSL